MHSQYSTSGDSISLCRKLSLHVDCFVFPTVSNLVFFGAVNRNAMSRLAPTFISWCKFLKNWDTNNKDYISFNYIAPAHA